MPELFRRLRYLLNRRRFDQELANDLDFHREMATREGHPHIGNTLHLREEARDAWGWTWIDRFGQDLRYAARMLRKTPGFTVAAVLMLGIGIGVNVAAFGFFNLMVLRPLPVRDPATLVHFQRQAPGIYASQLPYPEMAFFRQNAKTLSAFLAWEPSKVSIEGDERPLRAHFVTGNLFIELGATPRLGRLFDPAIDETPGAAPVVVLSYPFWERQFNAEGSIAGKTIKLNGRTATVAGVASREFSGLTLDRPDLWLLATQHPYFIDGSKLLTDVSVETGGLSVWGRLKPGATPKIAEDELRGLAAMLHRQYPKDIWENETLPTQAGAFASSAISSGHHGTGTRETNKELPLLALLGTLVLLILAVACGNLGSLLLARGVAREREIAIRVAVGAGKGRLVRQLFTESLLLGLLGSLAGLGLGYVALRSLMIATDTPVWLDPSPDWRVALFAVGAGIGSAVVFGLTPAFQVARQRHRATITRQVLIGAQVAASCVLLIVAGLLVRALNHANSADPGFEYQHVVSIDPSLGSHGYSPAKSRAYMDTLLGRLRSMPGVESASFATIPPLGNKTVTYRMEFDGRQVSVNLNQIDPAFLATMRIPVLRGRNLNRGDVHMLVISQSLALVAFPTEDALGKLIEIGSVKHTVVGIAGNARTTALQDREAAEGYLLADDSDLAGATVQVRTSAPPEALAPTLATIARGIDPNVLPEVQLLKTAFRRKLEGVEQSTLTVTLLSLVALLLACLGIVGLVAYAVSQRTKEIGIRMALGARPGHVLGIVLRQFSRPVGAGFVVGIVGAALLSQVLRRLLFGISNLDPIAYLGAIGVFAITVFLASLWPARRALRIDPIKALRQD